VQETDRPGESLPGPIGRMMLVDDPHRPLPAITSAAAEADRQPQGS
jgi:hypothetical protein